ncbi:hypothetical protein [Rubritalea sp.]|uniref:hypothetical protein n=1 Tax=Rubritalea sp. TaxID=2109375 RepID=UPI003EF1C63A
MSVDNPYEAPLVEQPVNASSIQARINEKLRDYKSLDEKAFKKLYYRSCNVSAIAALVLIAGLVIAGLLIFGWNEPNDPDESMVYGVGLLSLMAVFQLVCFIGLATRATWGRTMGFISCSLMLLNIPLGTLIGIVGLVALSKAPELFGPTRVTHKELKAEFKLRKQQMKEAKRAAKLEKKSA